MVFGVSLYLKTDIVSQVAKILQRSPIRAQQIGPQQQSITYKMGTLFSSSAEAEFFCFLQFFCL